MLGMDMRSRTTNYKQSPLTCVSSENPFMNSVYRLSSTTPSPHR